jgi:hypothetical protein
VVANHANQVIPAITNSPEHHIVLFESPEGVLDVPGFKLR